VRGARIVVADGAGSLLATELFESSQPLLHPRPLPLGGSPGGILELGPGLGDTAPAAGDRAAVQAADDAGLSGPPV